MIFDLGSLVGRKIKRRLREEQVIWLITINVDLTP